MSYSNFFWRFILSYLSIILMAIALLYLFKIEDLPNLNISILGAVTYLCFYSYSQKNSKAVSGKEKWKLIFLAFFADLIVSFLFTLLALINSEITIFVLILSLLLVMPFHFLLIFILSFLVEKQMKKILMDESSL